MLAAFLGALVRLVPAALAWWLFDQDDTAARVTVAVLAAIALVHPANEALKFWKVRYRITADRAAGAQGAGRSAPPTRCRCTGSAPSTSPHR